MEMDDDDMKEIAKFLPMLQASSKQGSQVIVTDLIICLTASQPPRLASGPIPLAPPPMYLPSEPTPATRPPPHDSSLTSTPSRNSMMTDEDDGEYVYDLYYRDTVVQVADLGGVSAGMNGAIGAL